MNTSIADLFNKYAVLQDTIESIKAELPQLEQAEKEADAVKKQIQEAAKEPGADIRDFKGSGYECVLSVRNSWDGRKLDGYAKAHPELMDFKSETVVASVKRVR